LLNKANRTEAYSFMIPPVRFANYLVKRTRQEETLELRRLRAFVAVTGTGHFGQAAAGLNLTQPGLTLRIQSLEKELGVQLLDRNA
jgi:hypothetical protein